MSSRNARATPLPPDERRAAILDATVPLVRRHGLTVSTRQIAEVAGVAEGTLFRVFPDKQALLRAAIDVATDPEPGLARLRQIDPTLPLEERLTEAVDVLREGIQATWRLVAAVRATETSKMHVPFFAPRRGWEPITAATARLFEPDEHRLAVSARQAARVLGTRLIATLHRAHDRDDDTMFTTAEMVDIVLYGVVGRPESGDATTTRTGSRTC